MIHINIALNISTDNMMHSSQVHRFLARRQTRRRLTNNDIYGNINLIDALSSMSRNTRSGLSLVTALQISVSHHPCDLFAQLHNLVSRGLALNTACHKILDDMSESAENSDCMMALHVIALASEVGGDRAQQLDCLIDTLLDRSQSKVERQTPAATATASIRLITWLPVVCGAWILSDSPAVRHVLLATPLGWACLTIGVGLNFAGRTWSKRMVRS
jgi:Flp pilus assembly protein TadB